MAWSELLRKIELENSRLASRPESEISKSRLQRYHKEERELHGMILEAEAADINQPE